MNFSKKSSCSYSGQYISPYERLLKRNLKWIPNKVNKEEQLQKLCQEEKLTPFEQPQNYFCYFIHKRTDIQLLDDLIDKAKLSSHFSIDTEDDPFSHRPATLQVEFIRYNLLPIVIIIEVQYLPSLSSSLFKKIQHLCELFLPQITTFIHGENHYKNLKNLIHLIYLIKTLIFNIIMYKKKFSTSELCGLQSAIKSEFEQYLDKTATLGEWACGLDLSLATYIPKHVVDSDRAYRIQEEENYRSILTQYAINDVFAITKLICRTDLSSLLIPPAIIEYEH